MSGLLAIFQIGASFGQWVAAALALSLSLLHPAPRHPAQHRHEPVRLPELASAAQLKQAPQPSTQALRTNPFVQQIGPGWA